MKTEVILKRDFHGSPVRQLSKSGFLCATDITEFYNQQYRLKTGKAAKQMNNYFENKETLEFTESICNELNLNEKVNGQIPRFTPNSLKMVKRGKDNKGTWLHPYLFIDYAMWLSPEFRAKVVIWVGDNLLHFRNASGDEFKSCNAMIDKTFNVGNKYWVYADIAKFVAKRTLGNSTKDQWNTATTEQLYQRGRLIQRIENAADFGNFETVDKLLAAL